MGSQLSQNTEIIKQIEEYMDLSRIYLAVNQSDWLKTLRKIIQCRIP